MFVYSFVTNNGAVPTDCRMAATARFFFFTLASLDLTSLTSGYEIGRTVSSTLSVYLVSRWRRRWRYRPGAANWYYCSPAGGLETRRRLITSIAPGGPFLQLSSVISVEMAPTVYVGR